MQVQPAAPQAQPASANVGNLIDLGDDTTTTTTQVADQMAKMSKSSL